MLDKTRLDSVAVNNPRPDVAKALCNDAANNAGFHLEIHGIPAATDPCHVDFKAELADGSLTTLRSEEHTSELQSLMRISYAVSCLKKKNLPSYGRTV